MLRVCYTCQLHVQGAGNSGLGPILPAPSKFAECTSTNGRHLSPPLDRPPGPLGRKKFILPASKGNHGIGLTVAYACVALNSSTGSSRTG
jgi:hypothetical protein